MSGEKMFFGLVAVFLFCYSLSLSAQQTALFKDMKITANWVVDPGIQAQTVISRGTKTQLKWLEIDVDYTTAPLKRTDWLDDVVMECRILLPRRGRRLVVLSGKVEYWAIAMDGQQHHAQVFVHPKFLLRYAPGLKLKRRELKDLRITISFVQNESVVGRGVYKPKSTRESPNQLNNDLRRAMNNRATVKVNNSVFSRDETPWAFLNLSYYELIKRKK